MNVIKSAILLPMFKEFFFFFFFRTKLVFYISCKRKVPVKKKFSWCRTKTETNMKTSTMKNNDYSEVCIRFRHNLEYPLLLNLIKIVHRTVRSKQK